MKKKVFALLLCVCMAFVFTACGSSSSDDSADGRVSARDLVPTVLSGHLQEVATDRDDYDFGKTKYNIATEKPNASDGTTELYGTFSLYDVYGKLVSEHYNEEFKMHLYPDGTYYCESSFGSTEMKVGQ